MDKNGLVRVLADVREFSCSGFGGCSGFSLNGSCSVCSGFSVEKLWRRLWESLWGKSGKGCGKSWRGFGVVENAGCAVVLHGLVEKFCYVFSTVVVPCFWWVLHSFHRPYYYNYYFFI